MSRFPVMGATYWHVPVSDSGDPDDAVKRMVRAFPGLGSKAAVAGAAASQMQARVPAEVAAVSP